MWPLETYVSPETPADYAALVQAQVDASVVLVQALGGTDLLSTLLFTLFSVRQTQRQIEISQEGLITDRFTHAIDQLGALDENGEKNNVVRLGGIYALERLARDSEKDHWTIMEVLSAYVRHSSPIQTPLKDPARTQAPIDIQTIITVIGRRSEECRERERQKASDSI